MHYFLLMPPFLLIFCYIYVQWYSNEYSPCTTVSSTRKYSFIFSKPHLLTENHNHTKSLNTTSPSDIKCSFCLLWCRFTMAVRLPTPSHTLILTPATTCECVVYGYVVTGRQWLGHTHLPPSSTRPNLPQSLIPSQL